MAHSVQLHDSFERNIGRLDQDIQDGIGAIVKSLESDEFFEPDENDYLFQRDPEDGFCTCRRISGWGDWQVIWLYEYAGYLPTRVETVIVMLVEEPLQVIQLKKKK